MYYAFQEYTEAKQKNIDFNKNSNYPQIKDTNICLPI